MASRLITVSPLKLDVQLINYNSFLHPSVNTASYCGSDLISCIYLVIFDEDTLISITVNISVSQCFIEAPAHFQLFLIHRSVSLILVVSLEWIEHFRPLMKPTNLISNILGTCLCLPSVLQKISLSGFFFSLSFPTDPECTFSSPLSIQQLLLLNDVTSAGAAADGDHEKCLCGTNVFCSGMWGSYHELRFLYL